MVFVIAGLQPKTKILDKTPRRCSQCGLHQAHIQQIDHYFSLFFIPLVRVKKGEPFLYCRRCRQQVDSTTMGRHEPSFFDRPEPMCRQCGRTLQKDFRYCPYCGRHQRRPNNSG